MPSVSRAVHRHGRPTTERTDPPTVRANGSAHGEHFRITGRGSSCGDLRLSISVYLGCIIVVHETPTCSERSGQDRISKVR